jgi:hypothetical protein
MIPHKYKLASDDPAQWTADQVGRQEVTAEWFWENGVDNDLALWIFLEGQFEFGLDPWRLREFDEVKEGQRLFVQKNQLKSFLLTSMPNHYKVNI